jgi:hypothetical protein
VARRRSALRAGTVVRRYGGPPVRWSGALRPSRETRVFQNLLPPALRQSIQRNKQPKTEKAFDQGSGCRVPKHSDLLAAGALYPRASLTRRGAALWRRAPLPARARAADARPPIQKRQNLNVVKSGSGARGASLKPGSGGVPARLGDHGLGRTLLGRVLPGSGAPARGSTLLRTLPAKKNGRTK